MRAHKELLISRLDEVQDLLIQGATPAKIIFRLQSPVPLPNCSSCKNLDSCRHGPPRWADENQSPVSANTIYWYIKKARNRIDATYRPITDKRRTLILARLERSYQIAYQNKDAANMINACRQTAELTGCLHFLEQLKMPTLFERVKKLIESLEDYEVGEEKDIYPKLPKLSPQETRLLLRQFERLLLKAEDSVAAYRKQPMPTDDIGARLYMRNQLVEAVNQALTSPGISPDVRRESIQKLATSYAMIAQDVDLAEKLKEIESLIKPS